MATISETLFLNGSYPTRIDQSINTSNQIVTAIYTYSDNSKVYGAYAYADNVAVDYLAAAYGLSAVPTPTPTPAPTPAPTPTLASFAVAANGLSISYFYNGSSPITSAGGTYSINGTNFPLSLLTNGSFGTSQIRIGDIIKITVTSTVPSTVAVTAATVANNSTVAAAAAAPLSFTKFNKGASAVGGKVTLTCASSSMVVSTPIAIADFKELQFIKATVPTNIFSVALDINADFTTPVTIAVGTGSVYANVLMDIVWANGDTKVQTSDGSGDYRGAVSVPAVPAGAIISIKKAANGLDAVVSFSTDNITFTRIGGRVNAFAGVSNVYVKVYQLYDYAQGLNSTFQADLSLL